MGFQSRLLATSSFGRAPRADRLRKSLFRHREPVLGQLALSWEITLHSSRTGHAALRAINGIIDCLLMMVAIVAGRNLSSEHMHRGNGGFS